MSQAVHKTNISEQESLEQKASSTADPKLLGTAKSGRDIQKSRSQQTNLFEVRLEFFAGPMDLLLHLVSQQEVAIEEVKMALIAEQYLEIVSKQSKNIDLDLAAEYLVIATTLLAIKSKSLLPADVSDEDDSLEDDSTRFFETLREKLRVYQITKDRALALIQTPQLGVDLFNRKDTKAVRPTPEMLRQPEDGLDLGLMFGRLLKRIGKAGKAFRVAAEPVSVVNFMMRILDKLSPNKNGDSLKEKIGSKGKGFLSLVSELLKEENNIEDKKMVRGSVIAGFIAVLELVKRGVVAVDQNDINSEINLAIGIDTSSTEMTLEEIAEVRSVTSVNDEQRVAGLEPLGDEIKKSNTNENNEKVVSITKYQEKSSESEQQETLKEVNE